MPHFELFSAKGNFLEHVFNATPERAGQRAAELDAKHRPIVIHEQGDPPPVFDRPEPPAGTPLTEAELAANAAPASDTEPPSDPG